MYDVTGKTYFELATDREFWLSLNPELTVSEGAVRKPPSAIVVDEKILAQTKETLIEEGYFKIENFFEPGEVALLTKCVKRLHKEQWPETFAYVYDEFWFMFHRTAWVMTKLLGRDYRQMPNIWVFHLGLNSQSAGWVPHRDRAKIRTLDARGYPHSINIWIPLTDATPENGCMYMLPAGLDDNYNGDMTIQTVKNFQDIRALPAKSGDFLGWNEAVFHWGGRSSKLAKEPRISLATVFQDTSVDPLEWPLMDPLQIPPFIERVGMIGQQFIRFQVQNSYTPSTYQLALDLSKLSEPILHFDATNPYKKSKVKELKKLLGLGK